MAYFLEGLSFLVLCAHETSLSKGGVVKRTKVLYLDVADRIRRDIFAGRYPVGSLLPTESEFEEIFSVSKITVRKAIELLAEEELVEKRSGKGTTVLSDRPYNKLSKSTSFTQYLEKSDAKIEKRFLGMSVIEFPMNDRRYELLGERGVELKRLYLLGGLPYIYFVYSLPGGAEALGQDAFEHDSLYRVLHEAGFEIATFSDDFSVGQLTSDERALLQTDETTALVRTRTSRDAAGCVVEYSRALYLTSLHPYHIDYEA